MKKTVCELFAGVGGFRCGLNHIKTIADTKNPEKWETVWFNQWEPLEKSTQYAHDCYVYHFGTAKDLKGKDTTNINIEDVDKNDIPDFNLLVGGFPCQDYSVASSLSTSKGLEGRKGVLWWSIRAVLEAKKPPFVLLENVDRLLKSPAKQRGRDFGIMLACFRDEGYTVEWRIINAAEYGYQQRRRRIFIFAYRNDTNYFQSVADLLYHNTSDSLKEVLLKRGFFASTFSVKDKVVKETKSYLPQAIGGISNSFVFDFQNTGIMHEGHIYSIKTEPVDKEKQITLGDVMETGSVDESYFIPPKDLYYTSHEITHSDESKRNLSKEERHTWQYIKGAKRFFARQTPGMSISFSEGAISMIDECDKPARTMLTSEGSFSRTTHIVRDKATSRIRLLTAEETERIQGFPTEYTKYCLANNQVVEMPVKKRRFMMGNALMVDLIADMEKTLSAIFETE